MFSPSVNNAASITFDIPANSTILLENLQRCRAFLQEHGIVDSARFSILLGDLFRNASYTAIRDQKKSTITIRIDALVDNAVQVTATDSRRGYQFVEISKIELPASESNKRGSKKNETSAADIRG